MWKRNRCATSYIDKLTFLLQCLCRHSFFLGGGGVPCYVAMTTPVPRINFTLLSLRFLFLWVFLFLIFRMTISFSKTYVGDLIR
jgi:hypothetical protein